MNYARKLNEDAVYWPVTGTTRTGQRAYGTPQAIKVRWEDGQEQKWLNNNVWTSKAAVMTTVAVKPLGVLWYGLLADLTDTDEPFKNLEAAEIKLVERIPSVSATEKIYTAFL